MTATASDTTSLARLVARGRRNPLFRKMAGLCRRYLTWYGNLSYDLQTNGEAFVLRTLARFEPRVLFDVGANVGDWTIAAHMHCPGAEIHSFEIAPPTYQVLSANTAGLAGVHCQNLGLSDAAGPIVIRHYADVPSLTTASDYPHPFPYKEITAQVTTGDAYAAGRGISQIDLLKIDVEGMEQSVLNGFATMLDRRAITAVQFEYGRVSILNHFLLRDFYRYFGERGYVVGKIFPNYVDFRDYTLEDEDFLGPNYLACRQESRELIEAFRGSPPAAGLNGKAQRVGGVA